MEPSFSLRLFAAALCAGLASSLAACGQSQPERSFATDPNAAVTGQFVAGQTLSAPITAKDLKHETASFAILSLPPEAVRNGRVVDKQYLNGWRQSISLDATKEAGDWNDLSIEIQAAPAAGGRGEIMMGKPTQEGIRREILARFPTVPMRIVNRPMANALGPYGLAIGAGAAGMRCAFAWQWVDNLPAAARGERPSLFGGGDMPASIRMRVCRRGVTADELAAWYEQLAVSPENLTRVVESVRNNVQPRTADGSALIPVAPGPYGGGRVTASVDSLESSLLGGAAGVEEPRPPGGGRRSARRAGRKAAAAPAAEPQPDAAAPAPAAPLTTPSSPSSDGRRYLGPVDGATSQFSPGGAAPRGGAGFGAAVDGGLPAQAFRGPSSARAITPYPGAQ